MRDHNMERDIKEEILAASFYENWSFARDLYKMKNPKAVKQFQEANKIQKEWLQYVNEKKSNS